MSSNYLDMGSLQLYSVQLQACVVFGMFNLSGNQLVYPRSEEK